MSDLKDILQSHDDYLPTTERLFGVDHWPLENKESKIPKTVPQLVQAIKSLTAYCKRQSAFYEQCFNEHESRSKDFKTESIKHSVQGEKETPGVREEQEKYKRCVEVLERQLWMLRRRSDMYQQQVDHLGTWQDRAVRLALLDRRMSVDGATPEEIAECRDLWSDMEVMYEDRMIKASNVERTVAWQEKEDEEIMEGLLTRVEEEERSAELDGVMSELKC